MLVPTLSDGTLILRAPIESDVEGSWEQCQDPLSRQWTTAPVPYTRDDARTYLRHIIPSGWETDREWGFVLEADDDGVRRFAGTLSLRNLHDGRAEVAYGAHPWARGKGILESALRLLVTWGFEERDLQSVVWLARRGNWASRRLAWRLGFSFEGTLRDWLSSRDGLVDAWVGTLRVGEQMAPRSPWLETPRITGDSVVLRALQPGDLPRVVETLNDPETQHWLLRAREGAPHSVQSLGRFVDQRLEQAAAGEAAHWAVADPRTDVYLGQVSLFDVVPGRRAELGYWAHPHSRRRGWTTEGCRLVVRHAFIPLEDGGLGLHRLVADAAIDNDASHRVLERAGFVRTGRDRQSTPMRDGTCTDSWRYDQLVADHPRSDW